MVSSGESNTKSIDASVGGLVWVRRRNGSWWPGRIMDLDELSANCLVSPKSGTPVKLLGREDASVDWYNLEKSKRVKAFRCGEYDKCIEKAKASAANSSKKAVKYARREDAILHALEIESGLLSKDRLDFCSRTENACGEDSGTWTREYRTVSHSCKQNEDMAEEVSTFEENSNSTQEISQSGLSFEEPNQISSSKVQFVQGRRRRTPNDSEDDGTEGIKRMRGLEDLGMGVLTKRMSQDGRDLDLIQEDNTSPCDSNTGNSLSIGSYLNGSKGDHLSWSRKRSQVVNVHESVKRKNRRRPLTKVLESTAMVSVPVLCNELASPCRSPLQEVSENKVFGLETNEPETSFLVAVYNSSDSTECKNATEIACDVSPVPYKIKENDISSISELPENAFPDTLFDVPFVGEEKQCAGFPTVYRSCSSGKPQASGQSSQAETVSLKNEEPIESGSTCSAAAHINNISQSIEKGTSKWKSKGKRKSRRSRKNKKQDLRKFVDMAGVEDMDGFSLDSICRVGRENHIRGITGEPTHQQDYSLKSQKLLPYRESRYTIHPKYQTSDFPIQNCHADSFLYDVPLEVKASYRRQHVPLVSLMSKLNGKAIVGHPLTIEVFTEGSCDYQVNENVNDGMTRRIPTKHPSKQARSSPSKPPKLRKCGIMSKKTRKLSSLTGSQMQSEEDRKLVIEKPKGPVIISCIPLSVVFSRLNEAVSGSTRSPNGC